MPRAPRSRHLRRPLWSAAPSMNETPMASVVLLSVCLSLGFGDSAGASVTKSVRATGSASVHDGNLAAAFEEAKRAALREAVEEAVGVLIYSHSRVRNLVAVEDDILSQTVGYVRQFEIVEQGAGEEDDSYRVTVDAVVDLGDLHRDLGAVKLLFEEAGRPRISCASKEFLVSEDGRTRTAANWGALEQSVARALRAVGGSRYLVVPDTVESRAVNGANHAEISVVGTATVEATDVGIPNAGRSLADLGLISAAATIELQAFWIDSGQLMASSSIVGRGADSSLRAAAARAIEQGVRQVAEEFAEDLIADLHDKVYSGRLIQLIVHGSQGQLAHFERDFPGRVRDVEKLYQRSYESGMAIYEARSRSAAFALARQLASSGLDGLDVDIKQVSSNKMTLVLSN